MNREQQATLLANGIKVQSVYTKEVWQDILRMINETKQKDYEQYDLICYGKFGPILKVSSTSSIKIVLVSEQNQEEISRLESLYTFYSQYNRNNHILGVFDSYYLKQNESLSFYISESELCDGMLVNHLKQLRDNKQNLSDELKIQYAIELLDALNFFHSKGITHRGIKQQSLFFKKENDGTLSIKLSGYGCTESKKIAEQGIAYVDKIGEFKGTEYFIPLEVLNKQINMEGDLFGLGILLLLIDNVEFDYSQINAQEFLDVQNEKYENQPFNSNPNVRKNSILYSIASKLLKKLPNDRLPVNEALNILIKHQSAQNYESGKKRKSKDNFNQLLFSYWNVRGVSQPIRFLMAYLNLEYQTKYYDDFNEWFGKDKYSLNLDFPNLPYLIDGDIKLTESSAIPVYIIKKCNRLDLLGENNDSSFNLQEIRVIQLNAYFCDILKEFQHKLCLKPDFNEVKDQYLKDKLQTMLDNCVRYLGDKEYFNGNLTYSDFIFYEVINYYRYIYPQTITDKLQAFIDRFENLPGIKEYIAKPDLNLKHFVPSQFYTWSGPQ